MSSTRTTPSPAKVGANTAVLRGMPEPGERLARRAGERVEHIGLAGVVDHVVEEGAELRARELGRGVGDRLHGRLEVELGGERLADAVQRLERARLLAQRSLARTLAARRAASVQRVADARQQLARR